MGEPDPDEIKAFLSLLRGLHQDAVIAEAERGLAETQMPAFPCQPDTEHPAYAGRQAASVRALMATGLRGIKVPLSTGPLWSAAADELWPTATVQSKVLTVKRAWGPAPFVGRPFVYLWDAAVDNEGRWVAGPVRIQHTMSEDEWLIVSGT